MKDKIVLPFLLLLFVQCSSFFKDEDFTLPVSEYTGTELRIDGYYYSSDRYKNEGISCLVFYNNSVAFDVGWSDSIEQMDNEMNKGSFNNYKDRKAMWGIFNISGDTVRIEHLKAFGGPGFIAVSIFGRITNDTTFIVNEEQQSHRNHITKENYSYHFRQFSPKPDSTNNFIK